MSHSFRFQHRHCHLWPTEREGVSAESRVSFSLGCAEGRRTKHEERKVCFENEIMLCAWQSVLGNPTDEEHFICLDFGNKLCNHQCE